MAVSYLRLCTCVLTAETHQSSEECCARGATAVTGSSWRVLQQILCKHFICMIKYCFSSDVHLIYSDVSLYLRSYYS